MKNKLIKHKWYYINPEVFVIKWNTTKGCKKIRNILRKLKQKL